MPPETTSRRFPPPWTVEETAPCFIVRDANGQALAYVYYEREPGRRAATHPSPVTGPAHRRQHHTNFSSSKLIDQID